MTHYIYHVPGKKIGCTKRIPDRIYEQFGEVEFEILEEYEDAKIAGDREKELQTKYGYKVDISHYSKICTLESRRSDETKKRVMKQNRTEEFGFGYKDNASKAGKYAWNKNPDKMRASMLRALKMGNEASIRAGSPSKGGKAAAASDKAVTKRPPILCPYCKNVTIKIPAIYTHIKKCKRNHE